ncbi:MAG: iron-containing alcohol dehydrogenase [bacterium]|nr:iron-containing alcohol dehydrogenase [bacterium]
MNKFELYNPIQMVFGVGEFDRLGELASEYGQKPLVVFGQKSARETGLMDRALSILMEAGLDPVVFEGIESNPTLATVQAGSRKAAENDCDMVIGIGGGSVMDASKIIAFGYYDPENIWKHIASWEEGYTPVEQALPIIVASTIAATGSEGNSGAVVTNTETNEKVGVFSMHLFPKVSIIDPQLTITTPFDYTRDGAIDMTIHVLESYFNGSDADFSDRATEGFFVEVIIALEALQEDLEDIEARSKLSYLGAIALTGFLNKPRGGAFPLHLLQHPLSAHFNISHGSGLALLLPRWLNYVKMEDPTKIIQLGDRCLSMELETYHPFEAADKVITRLTNWLEDLGAWFFMDDLGIPNDPKLFREIAEQIIETYGDDDGLIGGIKPLGVDDIVAIYQMCVRTGAKVDKKKPAKVPDVKSEEEALADDLVEIIEEVIEIVEGEEIPEGLEGEEIIVIEEIVEEEINEK